MSLETAPMLLGIHFRIMLKTELNGTAEYAILRNLSVCLRYYSAIYTARGMGSGSAVVFYILGAALDKANVKALIVR